MMEQAKIEAVAKVLKEDIERAKKLFELSPADAAAEFKKLGCDVSEEELYEIGEALKALLPAVNQNGEIDEDALDTVAGGLTSTLYGILGGTVVGAAGVVACVVAFGW